MRHTIAICTTGRRETLRDTLSVLAQSLLPRLATPTEVLVVINGSAKAFTSVERLVARLFRDSEAFARVLYEPTLGVARARNVALAQTTGDVLTFIDDDVCPCGAGWQKAIIDTFARRQDVGLLGGPIRCVVPPGHLPDPWWRSPQTDRIMACSSSEIASGPTMPQFIATANGSYRRTAMQGLRFPEALGWGAAGRFRLGGAESWFNCRLAERGWLAWYDARAVVDHHVAIERFSPVWIMRQSVTRGRSEAVLRVAEGGAIPTVRRRARRGFVLSLAVAAIAVVRLRPREAFARCLDAATAVGVFSFPRGELNRIVGELRRDGIVA